MVQVSFTTTYTIEYLSYKLAKQTYYEIEAGYNYDQDSLTIHRFFINSLVTKLAQMNKIITDDNIKLFDVSIPSGHTPILMELTVDIDTKILDSLNKCLNYHQYGSIPLIQNWSRGYDLAYNTSDQAVAAFKKLIVS